MRVSRRDAGGGCCLVHSWQKVGCGVLRVLAGSGCICGQLCLWERGWSRRSQFFALRICPPLGGTVFAHRPALRLDEADVRVLDSASLTALLRPAWLRFCSRNPKNNAARRALIHAPLAGPEVQHDMLSGHRGRFPQNWAVPMYAAPFPCCFSALFANVAAIARI